MHHLDWLPSSPSSRCLGPLPAPPPSSSSFVSSPLPPPLSPLPLSLPFSPSSNAPWNERSASSSSPIVIARPREESDEHEEEAVDAVLRVEEATEDRLSPLRKREGKESGIFVCVGRRAACGLRANRCCLDRRGARRRPARAERGGLPAFLFDGVGVWGCQR